VIFTVRSVTEDMGTLSARCANLGCACKIGFDWLRVLGVDSFTVTDEAGVVVLDDVHLSASQGDLLAQGDAYFRGR
jgi:hypothetical protein